MNVGTMRDDNDKLDKAMSDVSRATGSEILWEDEVAGGTTVEFEVCRMADELFAVREIVDDGKLVLELLILAGEL